MLSGHSFIFFFLIFPFGQQHPWELSVEKFVHCRQIGILSKTKRFLRQ